MEPSSRTKFRRSDALRYSNIRPKCGYASKRIEPCSSLEKSAHKVPDPSAAAKSGSEEQRSELRDAIRIKLTIHQPMVRRSDTLICAYFRSEMHYFHRDCI